MKTSAQQNHFRFLLIDDEPSVLKALCLLIEAIGYSAKGFSDSEEATAYLRTEEIHQHDLILCDLKMPHKNGLDVLTERNEHCANVPFILMSAHATNEDVEKALSLGAVGFLGKPFTPEQIHELVSELQSTAINA